MVESAAYGYVVGQLEHLKSLGEDPTKYEVVLLQDEYPQTTPDGMKVTWRIRLIKIV